MKARCHWTCAFAGRCSPHPHTARAGLRRRLTNFPWQFESMKVFCSTQLFRRPLLGKPPVPPDTKDRPFHSDAEGSLGVLLVEHTAVPQRASTIRSKAQPTFGRRRARLASSDCCDRKKERKARVQFFLSLLHAVRAGVEGGYRNAPAKSKTKLWFIFSPYRFSDFRRYRV